MESSQPAHDQAHPKAGLYVRVFVILCILTIVEVGVFYVPAFKAMLVPILLTLSAVKFALVVMFYMHLKMDSKLFTFLFGGPFLLATGMLIGLMFLFGAFALGK